VVNIPRFEFFFVILSVHFAVRSWLMHMTAESTCVVAETRVMHLYFPTPVAPFADFLVFASR
jgi:hypothetical protein